jgi:hypothetical protein
METYRGITRRKLLKTGFLILSLPLLLNAKQTSASIDEMTSIKMKYIIKSLRETQNVICIREGDRLERIKNNNNYYLNLRSAGINSYNAQFIANSIRKTHQKYQLFLTSFSISYNTSLNHKGLKVILESLPGHIKELGLVGCSFDDDAGESIVSFLTRCKNLTMVCVENNEFSNLMKTKIQTALSHLPNCTVVI